MLFDERLHGTRLRRQANGVGHVDRVEVAGRQEPIHRFEADVIGIDMVGLRPAQFHDGGVRGGAGAGRFGADGGVFAVGLVPDWDDLSPLLRGHQAGAQLGPGLTGKPVADAERILFQLQQSAHALVLY